MGYNHNFRYKNRVYHIQSEDSGVENPHIYSHIFHEGMIISSARTDYHDLAKEPNHVPAVRKLMQKQHKGLMKQLRRGAFDEKIIELMGSLQAEGAVDDSLAEGTAEVVPASEAAELPAGVDISAVEVIEDEVEDEVHAEAPASAKPVAPAGPRPAPGPELEVVIESTTPSSGDEAILAAAEAVISVVADQAARRPTPQPAAAALPPSPARVEVATEPLAEVDDLEQTRIERRAPAAALAHGKPAQPQPPDVGRPAPPIQAVDTVPEVRPSPPQTLAPEAELPRTPPPQTPPPAAEAPVEVEQEVSQFLDVDKLRRQSRARRGLPAEDKPVQVEALTQVKRTSDGERPSAQVSVVVDRPPAGSGEQERVGSPSFYSHVYRERTDSEQMIPAHQQPTVSKHESKVFRKPLPGAPRLPTPQEAMPELNPITPRRSGVYLVPGGPPQRPPHPDPRVRGQSKPPAVGPRYSSSPQQYTAPSMAAVGKKRKRSTGSYEELPAHQPPEGTSRPPTGDISDRAATASQAAAPPAPPPTTAPPAPPPPAPPPPAPPLTTAPPASPRPTTPPPMPSAPRAAEPVLARPAVIISQPVHVGPKANRTRPPSGRTPPLPPSAVPRPPTVPPEPVRLKHPVGPGPQPPRAAESSSVFGSDLISERSLDEVILAYLAEDSENAEE